MRFRLWIAQPTAQPTAPSQPASVAVPVAPTTPVLTQAPADPFAEWKAARARINGDIPHWLQLAEGDKLDTIKARIQALIEFAAIPAEAQVALVGLGNEHIDAIAKAAQLNMSLSAGLVALPPNTRSVEVSAATATINNLIATEQRKRNTSAAPTVTQSGAPAQPTQPALGQGGARTAEQLREWFERSVKANAGQRQMNDQMRNVVYVSLKLACGGDTDVLHRVLAALFEVRSFRDVSNAQSYALQAWLKPGVGTSKPINPHAAAEAEALAATVATEVQP